MKFGKTTYGGDRDVYTSSPLKVIGGFTLDTVTQGFNAGDKIPAGTLAVYDEITRKVLLVKTGKVKAIAADPKVVTLESSMHLSPIFKVGDQVLKTVTGLLSAAPSISAIAVNASDEYVITLSAALAGLVVGDIIVQVVADVTTPANAALIGLANAAVIASVEVNDAANETGIDVTIDSGSGAWYLRRIPAIPTVLMPGNVLLANPNIKYTKSV